MIITENAEEIISSCGPFEIIAFLNDLGKTGTKYLIDNFSDENQKNKSTLAHLIYYQKYFERYLLDFAKELEKIVIGNHRKYINEAHELPYSVCDYTFFERKILYKNIRAVQFTYGCGGACTFCGFDAPPGLRDKIPFENQIALLKDIKENTDSRPELYWASDFLQAISDVSEMKTIFNIFSDNGGRTSIPAGTEELYKQICNDYKIPPPIGVSLSSENISRLNREKILKIDSIDKINLFETTVSFDDNIINEIFCEGLIPITADIRYDENLKSVGINRYNLKKEKKGIFFGGGTLITPYGVYNVMEMCGSSKKYPQGLAVVAIDRLSTSPINVVLGEKIETYLKTCAITDEGNRFSKNELRPYKLENLCYSANVWVDSQGIIR